MDDEYRQMMRDRFLRQQQQQQLSSPIPSNQNPPISTVSGVPSKDDAPSPLMSSTPVPVTFSQAEEPILSDEELARRLQQEWEEEDRTLRQNTNIPPIEEDEDAKMARELQEEFNRERSHQVNHEDEIRPADRQFVDRLIGGPSSYVPFNHSQIHNSDSQDSNEVLADVDDIHDDDIPHDIREESLRLASERDARPAVDDAIDLDDDPSLQAAIAASYSQQ